MPYYNRDPKRDHNFDDDPHPKQPPFEDRMPMERTPEETPPFSSYVFGGPAVPLANTVPRILQHEASGLRPRGSGSVSKNRSIYHEKGTEHVEYAYRE